jgi:hypothetical protein
VFSSSTMERLFSPCTRLSDILESQGLLDEFMSGYSEPLQELSLDLSTDDFLSTESGCTYADLYTMLESTATVLWLTPHAAVARDDERVVRSWRQVDESCRFYVHVDGKNIVALARSPEHLLEICDVVIRLLAASVVHAVTLEQWGSHDTALIDAASLAYLMGRCQSLKTLTLTNINMDESHCRVLGVHSRPDLEIVLDRCKLTSAGTSALAEILGRNQGPTKLDLCDMDNIILADGLRGNSRLKRFEPNLSDCREVANRQGLAIAGALRENKGLVDLDLSYYSVSDETWSAICDSLKTHPTLEVLDLRVYFMNTATAPAVIASRMQTLVDMLKVSTSIHTLHFDSRYSEHELYRESIVPYLETNRHRSHVRAIQKTRPFVYRAKVLGKALLATRTDANSFWMLLSGDPEVAFLSTTATTTPATSLPEPSTAGATSYTATVTITTAVTVTAIGAASTTGASAVDIVAPPSAC